MFGVIRGYEATGFNGRFFTVQYVIKLPARRQAEDSCRHHAAALTSFGRFVPFVADEFKEGIDVVIDCVITEMINSASQY